MVLANNAMTLKQLQANIVNNHAILNDIHQVSTSTLARILKKKHIQMKQIYRVPFERNSERVKRLRHDYAEVCIHSSRVILHTVPVFYCTVICILDLH